HRAPDAETEVRAALRTVIARAMHGAPLHTHAIVARDIDPYLPIVHEQAAASTIAIAGPATRRLHDTVIGRFLVSSMRLEADAIHRDEFIAWCSDAPVRNPHDQTRVRAARWDYLTRKAGLISGPSMRVQLEAWQAEQRSKLAKCTSAQSRQAQAIASELADAEILQPFLDGLVEFLEDRAPRAWSAWSDALRAFLTKYLGTPNHRRTWPTAELDAGDDVERILDVLAELDGDTDWLTYCAALLAELDQPAGPVGRYGTGVFVGRIGDLTGTTFEHVTILGVNDGVMPRLRRSDPLLSDEARRAGALPTYDDQRGDERRAFLAALHSGTRTVCSFATTDMRRARPVLPSRWLVHWASVQLRAPLGASALATCAPTPWLTIDTSFVTGLNATPALHPTDALLQTWLAHGPGHVLPDSLRASWDAANQRREGFTAFEGNIGDDLDTAPSGSISPTAFETWARCGRNYFFSRILELDELQRPEALDGIRADDRGSLVHAVLDQFIAEARPRRTPDDAWDDDDHALLDSIFDAECARMVLAGRTGRAVHWDVTSRRLRRVAHRFLEHDNHVRAEHGVVPFATELRFGFADSELPPVVMADTSMTSPSLPSLPAMRGVIDRVDRSPDGTRATVYDYKTGAATSYKDITADDPTAGGTRFQLPAYAMAAAHATSAREIAAAYWFVSDRARPELVTLPINETTLATVVTEWRSITDAIARGLFPAVPGKPSFGTFEHCAICAFSEICPTDRDRTWEQVALDPLLAHHPALRSSAGDATTSTDGGDEA
ncbi:MAG: PD-(D/E)XK nuclease family protein, partial [Acidimicrobiia bacterium]